MRVVNICVNGVYTDGFSYQENLLPKYHKKNGNDVAIITSECEFNTEGNVVIADKKEYYNAYGVYIKRLSITKKKEIRHKLKRFNGLYNALEVLNPDVIFCHSFQFLDFKSVIYYVKTHRNVLLFVDSHADFNNSARNFLSKKILHSILWRSLAYKALPYTSKFYGVTPARVDFLKEVYDLPGDKCELLPLGADDEIVEKAVKPEVRISKRQEYGFCDKDFVIISGGKVDYNKRQIIKLMEAVNKISDENIKMIVFGSVSENLKKEFDAQLSNKVKYIGWKKSKEIYFEFAAADIVAFPGLHSVLWEQAVGMGKPCIFKKIEGFQHIDLGGNCMYFEKDDIDHYISVIQNAIRNIESMQNAAITGVKKFSYLEIAKKSIEIER